MLTLQCFKNSNDGIELSVVEIFCFHLNDDTMKSIDFFIRNTHTKKIGAEISCFGSKFPRRRCRWCYIMLALVTDKKDTGVEE